MQRTILTAITSVGILAMAQATTAQAQTATGDTGSTPLDVPTSSLPSTSSSSLGASTTATSGSTAAAGSSTPTVNGPVTTSGPAIGSTSGIIAPSSRSSQAPLELPGEGLDTSTQSASTTAAAPATPSAICPPPIPSTDGGSANIAVIDGFSPSGCP